MSGSEARNLREDARERSPQPTSKSEENVLIVSFLIQNGGKRRKRSFVPVSGVAVIVVKFLVVHLRDQARECAR